MLKRLLQEAPAIGPTTELELDFDERRPDKFLSTYIGGVGKSNLAALMKKNLLPVHLGVTLLLDTLAYDQKDKVYVRFKVGGTSRNLELFVEAIQRSELRIRRAVDSPWIVTDDDKVVPRPRPNPSSKKRAKDGPEPVQAGTVENESHATTPSGSGSATASDVVVSMDHGKKRSTVEEHDKDTSRPSKKAKLGDASLAESNHSARATSTGKGMEGGATKAGGDGKVITAGQPKKKEKDGNKRSRHVKSKAKRAAKTEEVGPKKEQQQRDPKLAVGAAAAGPSDGYKAKTDHKNVGYNPSFTFVPPHLPAVGHSGHAAHHEQKRIESKDEGKTRKPEEPDGRVSRNPRVSTVDTGTTGVTGVSNGAQSSFVFGPTARPVNNQSGRDVRHEQRPAEKNGEGKRRKMQASDREFELKGRGGSLGTQRTIATEENYRTQASCHSTPMSIAPPNGTAAVQGGRHVEWRSYKQWKGLVPVSNSSSQPELERPHGNRVGYSNPPWRNPFDTRPMYRAHSNYFPGAILPKSPGKSPAYVEDHARGVTVIVWSEEAQRLPVRYARPYIPRPKDPPSAPYEMPGPAFDASIMDDMFASHARLKAEQAEIAKLGKRKRGEEDDGADAAVDSDNEGPHAPRKRPKGSSDVQ